MPKGFYFTLNGDRYTYHYPTRAFKSDGTGESWTRGKVLGGSTTVNGMMYTRGFKEDYDELVKLGNPGWGWDNILPIYLQMEDHQLGTSPMRGAGGPYGVSLPEVDHAAKLVLESARSAGLRVVPDTNAESGERIGMTPSSIKNGKRVSAASAFLRPIRHRANLTILDRTRVGHLIFEGNRVVGVQARRRNQRLEFRARREVLVSAGTVESTMLLERSGIGRGDVLAQAGVYHAVGANAMGPNDDDVTDSRLRVRGVEGLRVVDSSSFPIQVSGNTAAPTMALAWRAADLIAEEHDWAPRARRSRRRTEALPTA